MSDALAIAAVTATLKDVITRSAQSTVSAANVVIGRPRAASQTDHLVFLYLYHVGPNPSFRNEDLPTRSGRAVRKRPKAALILRYLLAFHGPEGSLESERMLGAVVRDLHARPILSREDIADAISARASIGGADLADAIERIRVTPLDLSLEDLSKLWSVFFQTPHAVSLAYEASIVIIDAEETARPALPVLFRGEGDRGVRLQVGGNPALHSIHIGEPTDPLTGILPNSYPSAALGLRLLIAGHRLAGAPVRLRFRHTRLGTVIERTIAAGDVTGSQIAFTIPNDPAAASTWAAGIYDVTALIGGSATELPHVSNTITLALAPTISNIAPVNPVTIDADGVAELTITCRPDVRAEQRCALVLAGRSIAAEPRTATTNQLTFRITNAAATADARVFLRVDDVDSMPFHRIATPPGLAFNPAHLVTLT